MAVIFFQRIVAAVKNLRRTCPKCKRDQIVRARGVKEVVACKFCGAKIPPRV